MRTNHIQIKEFWGNNFEGQANLWLRENDYELIDIKYGEDRVLIVYSPHIYEPAPQIQQGDDAKGDSDVSST